ncbi:coiled-coil domain-containing protein 137 [Erpetoichthys calabaricus]|uniref:coiled-coil domain-containing protein 137 n=1 Tax=Erpetoichthys calabaricus TaxID=27687 RepID=UPI002234102F|nr:coiled-coil domain-containing protein 137 [Erpetoichthys calabaricus]
MGKNRKIKAVDPFYQGPRKEQILRKQETKTEKVKVEDDFDRIPFRLREIMKSQEKMKSKLIKKKKKLTGARDVVSKKGSVNKDLKLQTNIPVPHFQQRKNESEKAFVRRMNREVQHVVFLSKNQLDRAPEKEVPEERGKSEKKKEHDRTRLNRLFKKKEKRREQKAEKEMFSDNVHFGEVVMAPPSLTAKPRNSQTKTQGSTKGLLLSSLLGSGPVSHADVTKPSLARQRIVQEERDRVVKAYRDLKKLKQERLDSMEASVGRLLNPS